MDIQGIIKTVAPWIGTVLGGPLGGLAVDAACSALGLGDKSKDALQQALSGATTEQMLALKQADQAFAAQMQAMGFAQIKDLEALAVDDRKDARAMQVATKSKIPAILSVLVTIGYFGVLFGMMLGLLKVSESQALLLMIGSLSASWGMMVTFWFGSTAGSAAKTELLAKKD
jgi:hypothetical protein